MKVLSFVRDVRTFEMTPKLDLKSDFQTWLEKRQAPAIYYSTVYVIAKEGNKKKIKKKQKNARMHRF